MLVEADMTIPLSCLRSSGESIDEERHFVAVFTRDFDESLLGCLPPPVQRCPAALV